MIEQHDGRQRRCPMLGHPVAFSYCRAPGTSTPCRRIYDCWWETFDIVEFMDAHYDQETRDLLQKAPQQKMASLFEIMQQAQQRLNDSEKSNSGTSGKHREEL